VLPYLTDDVAGIGGVLRASPEDFVVDEVPAYAPAGDGEHVMVLVEKRDLTTPEAASRLAKACGVNPADVGWAGMKDRQAVTRQWLSLPPPTTPEAVRALTLAGITVLEATRHPHKLRTGHLRGNRFAITVRDAAPGAAASAHTILARLAEPPGSPNYYGEQRFGKDGDNAVRGRALLAGEKTRLPLKIKRLLINAVQSEMFNAWLSARLADGLFARVVDGDVLVKRSGSAPFITAEPATEEARVRAGEIVVTGPMFGPKMRTPTEASTAAAREDAVLAAAGLDIAAFAAVGRLAEGTRRPLAVEVADVAVAEVDATTVTLRFALPAGAYATAVLREVMK
jgi:tRNA pseudouridine13 synthase